MPHADKHVREAVPYAIDRGWTFEMSGPRAYSYGFIWCPHQSRDGCRIAVFQLRKPCFFTPNVFEERSISAHMAEIQNDGLQV